MEANIVNDVALLAGGHPSEHRISLLSAATLRDALLASGFSVHPVLIAQDGLWNLLPPLRPGGSIPDFPVEVLSAWSEAQMSGPPLEITAWLRRSEVPVVVLGLHGRGGEDGTIQGFLEVAGFAYTGCGVGASAVAIDKLLCKRVMQGAGLPTPPSCEVQANSAWDAPPILKSIGGELQWPVVVKAPALGSSVEVHIACGPEDLRLALASVFRHDSRALVEQYIAGREFTCPVVGKATAPEALPVIEIVPRLAGWFDEASKYSPGGAEEIVPARLDDRITSRLQDLACRLHATIGARGVTRTDMILDAAGDPWILEINTLPGMTGASLVPKAAAAAGITLSALVRRLVGDAIEYRRGARGSQTAASAVSASSA